MSIRNSKFVIRNYKKGMTYVEIIVVLSIFSIMSTAVIYNYHAFQSKIDIKNLASDIASKIVEAQKASLSGKLPPEGGFDANWKPSYGIYFFRLLGAGGDTRRFVYFTDLNQNHQLDDDETLQTTTLPSNIYIQDIESYDSEGDPNPASLKSKEVAITFSRPSSSAVLYSNNQREDVLFIQIKVASSDNSSTSVIKVYQSGRIQVN